MTDQLQHVDRRRLGVFAAAAVVAVALVLPAIGQDQPRGDDPTPASAPAEQVDLERRGPVTYTPSERSALDVAVGRPTQLTGTALYMLLAKATALPALSDEQWDSLDQPAYGNLRDAPERYAGHPIRMRLYAQVAQKLTEIFLANFLFR